MKKSFKYGLEKIADRFKKGLKIYLRKINKDFKTSVIVAF